MNLAVIKGRWVSPAASLPYIDQALTMARDRGRRAIVQYARGFKSEVLTKLGRLDEALALCDHASDRGVGLEESVDAVYERVVLANILVVRGHHERLAVLLGDVVPAARQTAEPAILIPALTAALWCAKAQQHESTARGLTDELIKVLNPESDVDSCQFLPDLARILAPAGRSDIVTRMVNAAPQGPAQFEYSVLTARAVLAEDAGDLSHAVDVYLTAAEGWRHFGQPLEQGQALLGAARCLGRLRQSADAPLAQARGIFTQLRAEALLTKAEQLLVQLH
jgi:hypothetical protein